ncbi:MAG: universal stress protein [Sphingobium sp.]
MSETRSILAATDLGARSDRAVDRAILLAQHWNLRPVIAHVVKDGCTEQETTLFLETAKAGLPDPEGDVDIILPTGPVPETIVATARGCDARLIVAAPARFNEPRDYFIGTAVDMIVRLSDRPVLVVKQRPHAPYRQIMIATDLSDNSRFALLETARLFPDAALHLIHGYTASYQGWLNADAVKAEMRAEAEEELETFLTHASITETLRQRVQPHLGYGEIDTVIDHMLHMLKPDLVVAGTHGKGGFVRAAMGSTAAELLNWVPIDMLMVRKPA